MRRALRWSTVTIVGLFLMSCAADKPTEPADGGRPDDAASGDGGGGEGGFPDFGAFFDGGDVDAMTELDAGTPADGGDLLDGGDPLDGSAFDAGVNVDSGLTGTDGGAGDGGTGDGGIIPAVVCSDCHGDADSAAPPFSLSGGTVTTGRGVGAHRSHLGTSTWHDEIRCQDCHLVPVGLRDVGHTDTPRPAELT